MDSWFRCFLLSARYSYMLCNRGLMLGWFHHKCTVYVKVQTELCSNLVMWSEWIESWNQCFAKVQLTWGLIVSVILIPPSFGKAFYRRITQKVSNEIIVSAIITSTSRTRVMLLKSTTSTLSKDQMCINTGEGSFRLSLFFTVDRWMKMMWILTLFTTCVSVGLCKTYPSRQSCLTVQCWTLQFMIRCAPRQWTPLKGIPCTPKCGGWLTAREEAIITLRSQKKAFARYVFSFFIIFFG